MAKRNFTDKHGKLVPDKKRHGGHMSRHRKKVHGRTETYEQDGSVDHRCALDKVKEKDFREEE
jgi:hypothetical protein